MDNFDDLTNQMLQAIEDGRNRFLNNEKPHTDRAYFNRVKEEADPIFELLHQWVDVALDRVTNHTLNLHLHQINSTGENMEWLILHSYYQDTRKRKFMEIYKSCYYIFIQCKKEHD